MFAARWIVSSAFLFCGCAALHAADRNLADSLATSGTMLAAKGHVEQAKELYCKALAHDEDCPEALYELGKLLEKEGSTSSAAELYQRAAFSMAHDNKPAMAAKRADAERRVKALNPYASRLSIALEEYAQDLDKVVKKYPDNLSIEAASSSVTDLNLPSLLPPDKLPKFYTSGQKPSATAPADAAATSTTPEVERELKALGWGEVSGVWIKKGPGIYEVTNGKLSAQKANGIVDVWVQKVGGGSVKACVRNAFADRNFMDMTLTGYGVMFKGKECKVYGPSEVVMKMFNGSLDPSLIRTDPIPESNPKNHAVISVNEGSVEFSVNDKRKSVNNPKLPRAGPFVIEVTGTVTLENPRCTGQ